MDWYNTKGNNFNQLFEEIKGQENEKKILKIKVKHTKEFLEGNDKIFVNPEAAVKDVNE